MENRKRTLAMVTVHLMQSKETKSSSQRARWFLRAAPASHQQQIPKQWLPEGGWDTALSSHGSSHGERQGKSCRCRGVCACGRKKNGSVSLTASDCSTTFSSLSPIALENPDTHFANDPILCLPYDYFVSSRNVPSLCHCYWEDTKSQGQIKHSKSYFLKFVNANCFPC